MIRDLVIGNGENILVFSMIAFIGVPLTCILMIAITYRLCLSKVSFSEQGIGWRLFRKQLKFFRWEEISSVGQGRLGMLAFYKGNDKIEVNIAPRRYKALMRICTDEKLKQQIRELGFLRFYNRKS